MINSESIEKILLLREIPWHLRIYGLPALIFYTPLYVVPRELASLVLILCASLHAVAFLAGRWSVRFYATFFCRRVAQLSEAQCIAVFPRKFYGAPKGISFKLCKQLISSRANRDDAITAF